VEAPPNYDLRAMSARYEGFTRVSRLIFAAERCPALAQEAYATAIAELKMDIDTGRYMAIVQKAAALAVRAGGAAAAADKPEVDRNWVAQTDRRAAQMLERLEAELTTHKNNLDKDAIRRSYNEIGRFCQRRGDMNAALKSYVRARDYCATSAETAEMCLNVIRVIVLSNA
ncbi:unnamed protein product, partial [Phaeothamnion confervicola]